jgi:RNA polymerase sigma-70 factor (ECF subfamily)
MLMGGDVAPQTSISLLGRVQRDPTDQATWDEFVRRYGPCIQRWCRHWNLQEADTEEVTQNVLVKLVQKMGEFRYDPSRSFRAWLKTLTHHAWQDFLASQRRGAGTGDSAMGRLLQEVVAREDLAQRLEEEYDRELAEAAMSCVRLRVKNNTWEAFWLMTFEQLSGAEAGARLGMQPSAVFMARSRVQAMIREEVRRLEGLEEHPCTTAPPNNP